MWEKLSNSQSGYDNITFYEIRYQVMATIQSLATNFTSLKNATGPLFNNFSHYIPVLNIQKIAF